VENAELTDFLVIIKGRKAIFLTPAFINSHTFSLGSFGAFEHGETRWPRCRMEPCRRPVRGLPHQPVTCYNRVAKL